MFLLNIVDSIKDITNPYSLLAFIAFIVLLVIRTRQKNLAEIIKSSSEKDRAELVEKFLEGVKVDTTDLTKEQRYNLAQTILTNRSKRTTLFAIVSLMIAVIVAIVIIWLNKDRVEPEGKISIVDAGFRDNDLLDITLKNDSRKSHFAKAVIFQVLELREFRPVGRLFSLIRPSATYKGIRFSKAPADSTIVISQGLQPNEVDKFTVMLSTKFPMIPYVFLFRLAIKIDEEEVIQSPYVYAYFLRNRDRIFSDKASVESVTKDSISRMTNFDKEAYKTDKETLKYNLALIDSLEGNKIIFSNDLVELVKLIKGDLN